MQVIRKRKENKEKKYMKRLVVLDRQMVSGNHLHLLPGRSKTLVALLHHPSLSEALNSFTTNHITELKQIHAYFITSGLSQNTFPTTRFLAFLSISKHGDLNYAKFLFQHISNPTLFMFNTMIRALSQTPFESIDFYIQMLRFGVSPDKITFPFLLKSSLSHLRLGQQLHTHVLKLGFYSSDVFVVNNAINMYSNCGGLSDARRVFDESSHLVDVVSWTTLVTAHLNSGEIHLARRYFDSMPCRNTVAWNAMIYGYARSGEMDEARKLFDEMPLKNVASWSSLISGYSQSGTCKEALELFNEMIETGTRPNESSLVSSISACAQLRALEEGIWLHSYILENKFEINVTLGTALVDMYGKCGNIEKALEVFNEMPMKNVLSWNSMITGLALNGYGKEALSLFWQMHKVGDPTPNSITFIGVLSGCSHSGLVEEGRKIFDLMTCVYEIKPQLEHYGCMVDLFSRAGLIKEALEFVEGMPVEPHPGLWGAIVGACRIHGEVKVGEEVGKHLIEMEPHHSGRYVLLSNLLAAAERWDDVETVRNLLKDRNVLKNPGNSTIETSIS